MCDPGSKKNSFKLSKKFLRSDPLRPPGFVFLKAEKKDFSFQMYSSSRAEERPLKKTGMEIFVGNLPPDITEMEIAGLFKDFGLKNVRKKQTSSVRSFAFLEMVSPEAVQHAVKLRNGIMVKGQRIFVSVSEERSPESRRNHTEMPDLEPIPNGLPVVNGDLIPKPSIQTAPPSTKKNLYAIPIEMRCSFLLTMLHDCFKDVGWLINISRISGEAALLVTDTMPQTPFFWAIHLTEESHRNMQKLFSALAEVESQMPFLTKQEVKQGTRCMAECIVGEEGEAWNRCWVLDKVGNQAVVFFVDFGRSATVPLSALRRLDKDDFWTIQPLAQPFMLHKDVFPPQMMIRQILEGKVSKQSQMETHHVLRFTGKTN